MNGQWFGPGEIEVPQAFYSTDADIYWMCTGPCCAVKSDDDPTTLALVYYDGVGRDAYFATGEAKQSWDQVAYSEALA